MIGSAKFTYNNRDIINLIKKDLMEKFGQRELADFDLSVPGVFESKSKVLEYPKPVVKITSVEDLVAAWGMPHKEEVPRSSQSVYQDPDKIGGSKLIYQFDRRNNQLDIFGDYVAWTTFPKDDEDLPKSGHWVGIVIEFPLGMSFNCGDKIPVSIDGVPTFLTVGGDVITEEKEIALDSSRDESEASEGELLTEVDITASVQEIVREVLQKYVDLGVLSETTQPSEPENPEVDIPANHLSFGEYVNVGGAAKDFVIKNIQPVVLSQKYNPVTNILVTNVSVQGEGLYPIIPVEGMPYGYYLNFEFEKGDEIFIFEERLPVEEALKGDFTDIELQRNIIFSEEGYPSVYFPVRGCPEHTICIKGADVVYVYNIDSSAVQFQTAEAVDNIIVAPLYCSETGRTTDELISNYSLNATRRIDSNGLISVIDVKLYGEALMEHTPSGDAPKNYWVGVGIPEAEKYLILRQHDFVEDISPYLIDIASSTVAPDNTEGSYKTFYFSVRDRSEDIINTVIITKLGDYYTVYNIDMTEVYRDIDTKPEVIATEQSAIDVAVINKPILSGTPETLAELLAVNINPVAAEVVLENIVKTVTIKEKVKIESEVTTVNSNNYVKILLDATRTSHEIIFNWSEEYSPEKLKVNVYPPLEDSAVTKYPEVPDSPKVEFTFKEEDDLAPAEIQVNVDLSIGK